ncbi:MAG: Cro/Cl family transcriptional regulator [Desulfovibrionales bacterium]|nr:Cro/Cl family transcriptional regulator [Desulfovibrionales bacterium]
MSDDKNNSPNFQKASCLEDPFGSSGLKLPNKFDEILGRLKQVFDVETDTDFARSMGFRQGAVSSAKQKQTIPPAWITEVALSKGVSADWLLTGEGEMKREGAAFIKRGALPNDDMEAAREKACYAESKLNIPSIYNGRETLVCHDCEITMVPMVEARLSAGGGSWETSADSDRRYAFRTDFLRRKGNASAMVLMRVAGDSMEPEIKDNDIVLVDTSNVTPRPGRIYAIAVEDLVYLKKVDAEPGKLILTSANQAYAPLEIDARGDLTNGIRIIGKAVWVGRELD